MKVIIDENVEPRYETALYLRNLDYERTRPGETDESIINWARSIDAYVLTHDKDFKTYKKAIIFPRHESIDNVLKKISI